MAIDKISSERLSMLRFPLVVGVVFIHSYKTTLGLADGVVGVENASYFVDFLRDLVSQGIARTAVPLFFLMSGYFFFLYFPWSLKTYGKKVKSRVKTLLIPFLFWNILTLLLFALAQSLPATQAFFSGENEPIATFGIYDYFNAIFGITGPPISYQFWFIRDLMVMVLLAPVIYFTLKRAATVFLVATLTLWLFEIWPIYIPSDKALAFFYLGAYFAYRNISLFTFDRFGFPILASYSGILLTDTLTKDYLVNPYIHNVGVLFGIASILFVTKSLIKRDFIRGALLWASSCSFFVFAVHEPFLRAFRKVSYKFFTPSNSFDILSLYFLNPTLIIIFAILLYVAAKSIAPKFLGVISGGRGA